MLALWYRLELYTTSTSSERKVSFGRSSLFAVATNTLQSHSWHGKRTGTALGRDR